MGFPNILYRYSTVTTRTLEMLHDDKIYCADPISFNDPLDCRANINVDVSTSDLEKILYILVKRRVARELNDVQHLSVIVQKQKDTFINKLSKEIADRKILDINYLSTDEEFSKNPDDAPKSLLVEAVEKELNIASHSGIFCLSELYDSTLMWSHYGEHHKGICIGYGINEDAKDALFKVEYDGLREFKASDLLGSLEGDKASRLRLHTDTLLRKAKAWEYEKEWRYIDKVDLPGSPFRLESITFGWKCPQPIIAAVAAVVGQKGRRIKFYKISIQKGSFKLTRHKMYKEDLAARPVNNDESRRFMKDVYGGECICVVHDEQDPLCPPCGHD